MAPVVIMPPLDPATVSIILLKVARKYTGSHSMARCILPGAHHGLMLAGQRTVI